MPTKGETIVGRSAIIACALVLGGLFLSGMGGLPAIIVFAIALLLLTIAAL